MCFSSFLSFPKISLTNGLISCKIDVMNILLRKLVAIGGYRHGDVIMESLLCISWYRQYNRSICVADWLQYGVISKNGII